MIGLLTYYPAGLTLSSITDTLAIFRRKFPDQEPLGIRLHPLDADKFGPKIEGLPVVVSTLTQTKNVYIFTP